MTERVAILGMDGSGKSTLAEALRPALTRKGSRLMRCPEFHDSGNVPHAQLSRDLQLLSQCADLEAHHVLKFTSLYLRMTLFGPIEAALMQDAPPLLLQERHAIVDSLVYNAIYAQRAARDPGYDAKTAAVRRRMEATEARAFAAVEAWLHSENARLGLERPLKEVSVYCATLAAQGLDAMLAALPTDYRTTLPDRIFFLDVSAEVALERLRTRGGKAELHEHPRALAAMRQGYLKVFAHLQKVAPRTRIEILDANRPIAALAADILPRLGL